LFPGARGLHALKDAAEIRTATQRNHGEFFFCNPTLAKRRQLEPKIRNIDWLINKKSQLSHENKITIYKAIIKPVWTYGIELWG
jgi:hypothetical protein